MQYRRATVAGGTFFFTIVTRNRSKILTLPQHIITLRKAFHDTKSKHSFDIDAIVILPEHIHCIWILPKKDSAIAALVRCVSDVTGYIWCKREG